MRVDQTQNIPMDAEVPPDAVGRRVACDGERGTVRYVGALPPTAGLWLGIEWDNPARGKHDGSHQGVSYFTCKHPQGASFVRPKKASFGVDYLTAIRQQYESDVEEVLQTEFSFSTKTLKMVGFKDVSEMQRAEKLTNVSLYNMNVCGPGAENEIQRTTPDVLSLDLSGSLMCCWEDVAAITRQMTQLRELYLLHNRLCVPSDALGLCQAFSCLKTLILSSCALTWSQVLDCAPMWPEIEVLCLSHNDITELQRPHNVLQSLKSLDLSNNTLVEESVLNIAELPRLDHLNMSNTGLSSIRFEDVPPGSETTMFPALTHLTVPHNNISEWWVINELAKLRGLTKLSVNFNPLMSRDGNPQTNRGIIIAKLGHLAHLNNSQITAVDRRGAELDYIKMHGEEWLKAGGHQDPQQNHPNAQFTAQHPRYQILIEKHGAPEEGELKKQQPFALKNQLISVTFVCPDETDRKPIVKKLPDSMVVQKVKGLLYRLLKISGTEITLSYSSVKMGGKEIEIDNDLKPLQFYSIEDGDKVLVRWS